MNTSTVSIAKTKYQPTAPRQSRAPRPSCVLSQRELREIVMTMVD